MSDEDIEAVRAEARKYLAEQREMFHEPPLTKEQQAAITQQYQRDTQFAGFARLLAEDCAKLPIDLKESAEKANARFQRLIAQRTYDFTCHMVRSQTQGIEILFRDNPEYVAELVKAIPDMTEWPKKEEDTKPLFEVDQRYTWEQAGKYEPALGEEQDE